MSSPLKLSALRLLLCTVIALIGSTVVGFLVDGGFDLYPFSVRVLVIGIIAYISMRLGERDEVQKEDPEDGLKIVSQASDDAYWMAEVDPETFERQIIYVNPVFEKIWGRKIEDLKKEGCVYNRWIHENDYPWVGEALTGFLKGEHPCDIEFRINRPDGSTRWIWTKAQRMLDENGKINRVVGISRDVTRRKEIELKLVESESRFRSLFENSQDAIKISSMDGRMTQCNPAFTEMLGYSEGELVGMHCRQITPDKWVGPEMDIVENQVLPRGYSDLYEKEYVRKDGEKITVHVRTFVLKSDDGQPIGLCGIARDVTDQKLQEASLLQAKREAEAANASKDRFLATVSHELRTPLNPIVGYAEILLSRVRDPMERRFLDTIKESAKSMARLVTDVLNYAMIESGKTEIIERQFTLSRFVSLVERQVEGAAKENRNKLSFEMNCPDCHLYGDDQIIRQIVVNLLINALKFTNKGSVCMECHLFGTSTKNRQLKFVVRDTGIGISKDQIDRIFEPFEQLGSIAKAETQGVGLGLAICKHLTHALNGSLKVQSELGVGTTFELEIPIGYSGSRSESKNTVEQSQQNGFSEKPKVLVVEDESVNRSLLRDYVLEFGCDVVTSQNGREALELLEKEPFDLVFMDISMPDMNGIETTNMIRSKSKLNSQIPVVAVSAHVTDRIKTECYDCGMNDFVEKPISAKSFSKTLKKWIEATV